MSSFSKNSYSSVVLKLNDRIQNLTADTLQGQQLVNQTYQALQDGITPLHTIRDFIMQSRNFPTDVKLNETASYCASVLKNNRNLNFHMGLCREEHFKHLQSLGIPNPENTVNIEDYNQPEILLRQAIKDGVFDSLHSSNLQNVKNYLNITPVDEVMSQNGYIPVLQDIIDRMSSVKTDNQQAMQFINGTYQQLLESKTPFMELKQFITDGEAMAKHDATLGEVVKFCKKAVSNDDLNFLINLCKEEHYNNLHRSGHKNVEETIKDIEKYFEMPAESVAKAIKEGVFDGLESRLLNDVKQSLGVEIVDRKIDAKVLNEAAQITFDGIAQYCPVGIACSNGESYTFLVESDALIFNQELEEFDVVDSFEPTPAQKQLLDAVQQLQYDPITEEFSLNESWDFDAKFSTQDGNCYVSKKGANQFKPATFDQMSSLLFESLDMYEKNGTITSEGQRRKLFEDADRFRILVANQDKLVKFNNLRVVKNLNENSYIMFETELTKNGTKPKLLNNGGMLFESYHDLVKSANQTVGTSLTKLFESELISEQEQVQSINETIEHLKQENQELNESIVKKQKMLSIVEEGSPAWSQLNEEYDALKEKLQVNLNEMNYYINDMKLHE